MLYFAIFQFRHINKWLNLVFGNNFTRYRREILYAQLLMVEGKIQKEGSVIHVVAHRLYDCSYLFNTLDPAIKKQISTPVSPPETTEDKLNNKPKKSNAPAHRQLELFPKGRSFK